MSREPFTFVVEHLDPELGPWSVLEYRTIAEESDAAGCKFVLSCLPKPLVFSTELQGIKTAAKRTESVENLFAHNESRVCLLDPAAEKELSPGDGNSFDVFLFGGILGEPSRCTPMSLLADPNLGDDPPRGSRTLSARNIS
jgi:carboxypeptidase D